MKQKTHYYQQPEKMEIINVGDKDLIYVRENIEKETINTDGSGTVGYIADEYFMTLPHPATGSYKEYIVAAKAMEYENLANLARNRRDQLLSATDYLALSDQTMPENVKDYRQKIRDIPEQSGFPYEIEWPEIEKPE